MSVTLEEKLAIHELLSKASYAYDARDLDMLAACFTPDATLTMRIAGGDLVGPFDGRDAIMGLMGGSMAEQTDVRRHVVSNIFFDDSADGTAVKSFLTLVATENGETRVLSTGVYHDTVVADDAGAWRLAQRYIELDNSY